MWRGPRGSITRLPGGSLRVRVYAGLNPITGQERYLRETIPDSPTARDEAEAVCRRKLHYLLSGAYHRAVRWGWIDRSLTPDAEPPSKAHPNPRPPTPAEAARILTAA